MKVNRETSDAEWSVALGSPVCSIGRKRRRCWGEVVLFFEDHLPQAFEDILVVAKRRRDGLQILEHVDGSFEQELHLNERVVRNVLPQMLRTIDRGEDEHVSKLTASCQ